MCLALKMPQQNATMCYNQTMPTTYFTPEEVATKLNVCVETIRRYLRTKKLPGTKVSSKCWRVYPSDLYEFLQRRKNE
jgi:excisionase family DNA binding protein